MIPTTTVYTKNIIANKPIISSGIDNTNTLNKIIPTAENITPIIADATWSKNHILGLWKLTKNSEIESRIIPIKRKIV